MYSDYDDDEIGRDVRDVELQLQWEADYEAALRQLTENC